MNVHIHRAVGAAVDRANVGRSVPRRVPLVASRCRIEPGVTGDSSRRRVHPVEPGFSGSEEDCVSYRQRPVDVLRHAGFEGLATTVEPYSVGEDPLICNGVDSLAGKLHAPLRQRPQPVDSADADHDPGYFTPHEWSGQ